MILNKSLGVFIQGETLQLALLSRQFNRIKVLDLFTVPDFRQKPILELQREIARYLGKNKASNSRCVLVIPRHEVIVRQMELPSEAEANLTKVVEYQLASLVPSEEASVCYDFCVSKPGTESKTFLVTVFLCLRTVLESSLQECQRLGLRVDLVLPSSAAIAICFGLLPQQAKAETALVANWDGHRFEMVGILRRAFHLSREFAIGNDENLSEILKREVELFRSQARLQDETVLDVFVVSNFEGELEPDEKRYKLHRLSLLQSFGLEVAKTNLRGFAMQEHFLALAASMAGLKKKNPIAVNLLPAEMRVSKSKWMLVPTYALLGINLLFALSLLIRRPIQQHAYSAQLNQEIARLEPEVRKINVVEREIADLQRRSELLMNFKKSHRLALDALNELSKILPGNTWVSDLNMKTEAIEISGASESAAALPQILDNSPYFKEAEFVAPILKDASGKEIYRIRMKLEGGPGSLVWLPSEGPSHGVAPTEKKPEVPRAR